MNEKDMEKINRKYIDKKLTPLKRIKLYCKENCCAGDLCSWKHCSKLDCFLYPLRLGVRNEMKYYRKMIKNRKEILKRDKYKCKICFDNNNLIIHHIDETTTNNNNDNLITLCNNCHHKIHDKQITLKI